MPTPDDVIAVLEPLIGLAEDPDGSSHAPPITQWYGMTDAWCAMTVSYAAAHGGFSPDGGQTLDMAGIPKTTAKGWAYVPYLAEDFSNAGRFDGNPRRGDFGIVGDMGHVFLVEDVDGDQVLTIEGNYGNRLVRARRSIGSCDGFCHLPYDGSSTGVSSSGSGIPAYPGFVRLGLQGQAVIQVQKRLSHHGFTVAADGDFGPQTDGAVRQFQTARGLEADGVVGPITWAALWA